MWNKTDFRIRSCSHKKINSLGTVFLNVKMVKCVFEGHIAGTGVLGQVLLQAYQVIDYFFCFRVGFGVTSGII